MQGLLRGKMLVLGLLTAVVCGFAGCDLFDPPPSNAQVQLALDDLNAAVASVNGAIDAAVDAGTLTATSANGTVKATWTRHFPPQAGEELVYVISAFQGMTNSVDGTLTIRKTGVYTEIWSGTINFTGGAVRSFKYNDIIYTTGANGEVVSSEGTYTINGLYTYDEATGQRVY